MCLWKIEKGAPQSIHTPPMNLFVLSTDVAEAARFHLDKHVIKMLLEACQLLYTAHWAFAYPELLAQKSAVGLSRAQKVLLVPESLATAPRSKMRPEEPGYRPCHIHHPCAKWVRESFGNYMWAAGLAIALAMEYEYRWPGKPHHECFYHAAWLASHPPAGLTGDRTSFVQAMEDRFKDPDPVVAYRRYYVISKGEERGMWKYTKRDPPVFVI